jgi:vancomycin resistance protein YoaR
MEVAERHRHQFQPSYVPPGRDAAVAFSHIDLKLKNPHPYPVRIEAKLDAGMVKVSLIGAEPPSRKPIVYSDILSTREPWTIRVEPGTGRRVRNSGKSGWEVAVYRKTGSRTELISKDTYPVMHRVTEPARWGLNPGVGEDIEHEDATLLTLDVPPVLAAIDRVLARRG